MGRTKKFSEQLRLPIAAGTTARIDAVLKKGEARLDLIRGAIEREVAERERTRGPTDGES